jgi:hypothetical protein
MHQFMCPLCHSMLWRAHSESVWEQPTLVAQEQEDLGMGFNGPNCAKTRCWDHHQLWNINANQPLSLFTFECLVWPVGKRTLNMHSHVHTYVHACVNGAALQSALARYARKHKTATPCKWATHEHHANDITHAYWYQDRVCSRVRIIYIFSQLSRPRLRSKPRAEFWLSLLEELLTRTHLWLCRWRTTIDTHAFAVAQIPHFPIKKQY